MKYGYVWGIILGAHVVFSILMVALAVIRRSRRLSRGQLDPATVGARGPVYRWGHSRFWWRRMQAARWLAHSGGAEDRELIARLLRDSHHGVQSAASASLLRYADERLIASVIDTLAIRAAAIRVYQSNVLRQHAELAERLLLDRMRADAPPAKLYSYIFLAQVLKTPACVQRVAGLSIHQNPEVRVAVARALQGTADDDGVIKLVTMLRDPDWRVRAQAARGLGTAPEATSPDERVVTELARGLTDSVWWVRFRAGLALASLGEPGRRALEGALARPDRYARDMAAFVYALSPASVAELSEG